MIEDKIKTIVNNGLKDRDMWVDTIKYEKEGNNNFLRIIVDSKDIIDIDTVVEVTKIIDPLIEDADIIKDSYILDISSKEKGE